MSTTARRKAPAAFQAVNRDIEINWLSGRAFRCGCSLRAIALIAGLALASFSAAHHSDAGLDLDSVVVLEGTVTEFDWRNPHVYLAIQTENALGETVEWELQTVAVQILIRSGWSEDTLLPGDEVLVRGHPAVDGRNYALLLSVEKDGEVFVPIRATTTGESARRAETLAGVWRGDRSTIGDFTEWFDRMVLTEKAIAARDAFDVFSDENPVTACIGRPTPASIVSAGLYLSEIEIEADAIHFRNEIFDVERVVHMDGRPHPENGERTIQGHSIGRWEDDVLVVDTRLFADHRSPYQNGVPSGEQKHVVERYRLIEDGARLSVEIFLEDPEYLAEPLISTLEWIYAPEAEYIPFACDENVTRQFIPTATTR